MDVFITIPYLGSLEFDKIFSSLLTKVGFPKGLEELLIKRLVRTNKGETSRSLKKKTINFYNSRLYQIKKIK